MPKVAEDTNKRQEIVCYGGVGGDAQSESNIILLRIKVVFYSFLHSISTQLCQQQPFFGTAGALVVITV